MASADAYANTSPTCAIQRRRREQPHVADDHGRLIDARPLEHAAVRIDDAADAGVGGAHQVAAFFDRPHRRLLEVLVRR